MWHLVLSICLVLQIHQSAGISVSPTLRNKYGSPAKLHAVNLFREYVQIDTSNPDNIGQAVDFLIRLAKDLELPYAIYEPAGKPIFVATVKGRDPCLPSIMLNSHMDVVKADPTEWKYPPFSAHIDKYGDIYGRGTQDTKDLGIQYFEAIRRLKKDNITLLRTLHVTFMPDEEDGSQSGMAAFAKTDEFKALNIGFALDEGSTQPGELLTATYVDKRPWQMTFIIRGGSGHSYTLPNDSAMVKTQHFLDAVMDYRQTQIELLATKNQSDVNSLSEITSLNVNVIEGGNAVNIIPSKVRVVVDMRLSEKADVYEMDDLVQSWIDVTENSTEIAYIQKVYKSSSTPVDDSNPYWITLKTTLNNMGIEVLPIKAPATTDMLVLRNLGIPALGFTTKRRTEARLHSKDEYQNVDTFIEGIGIFKEVIKNLGNLEY